MNTRDLANIGIPPGACADTAKALLQTAHAAKQSMTTVRDELARVAASAGPFRARTNDAPYQVWGANLEPDALQQMKNACKLPVAVSGALMPDAHVGYGLPIGGVLATSHTVIPYPVGVDIACRMKLSVLGLPLTALADEQPRLKSALERETRFGM